MTTTTHPTKEQLQKYLNERHKSKEPPPDNDQVRRELGWELIPGCESQNKADR